MTTRLIGDDAERYGRYFETDAEGSRIADKRGNEAIVTMLWEASCSSPFELLPVDEKSP